MLLQETILTGPSAPSHSHNPSHPTKTALPLGEAADIPSSTETDTLVASVSDIKLSSDLTTVPSAFNSDQANEANVADANADKGHVEFWNVAEKHLVPLKAPWLDFVPVRAEGAVLYDKDGRQMLDFTSGQMSSLLGQYVFSPFTSSPSLAR